MELKWYAVYTRPRWEKKVADNLSRIGIEYFCPLNKVLRKWSDRKKVVYEPLFTSYVFVRTTNRSIDKIKMVSGIVNFVTWLGEPAVIPDKEIDSVRQFINDHQNIKIERTSLKVDDKIKIINGPFKNQEGKVIELHNKSVKVEVPSLGVIMIAEVNSSTLVTK